MSAELEVPTEVEGLDGRPVRVGDRIAYAVREGDRAALRLATVLGFHYSSGYSRVLKIRVTGSRPWWGRDVDAEPKPVSIDASLRRFALIEAAA